MYNVELLDALHLAREKQPTLDVPRITFVAIGTLFKETNLAGKESLHLRHNKAEFDIKNSTL